MFFFFYKQNAADGMRISDWSPYGCSSDLSVLFALVPQRRNRTGDRGHTVSCETRQRQRHQAADRRLPRRKRAPGVHRISRERWRLGRSAPWPHGQRSEEHTSELPSLMRTSSAVSCLKKKQQTHRNPPKHTAILYTHTP